MKNFREAPPADESITQDAAPANKNAANVNNSQELKSSISKGELQEEEFALENIPNKVQMINPLNPASELAMIVHHVEACYHLRKFIIEGAKKQWKELDKVNLNAILSHTASKQKQLDSRFEEQLARDVGLGQGEKIDERNYRITYKTFLPQ